MKVIKCFNILFSLFLVINTVDSLDNGLALTPPMGWMSWQRFRCLIDCEEFPEECLCEKLIKEQAERMVEDGYLAAGYEYIIIDDCWSNKSRDSQNRLLPDPERFPSGMKSLADHVHSLGLKLGIYGDYGTFTCGGYPGSINYLEIDAQTYADWGIDYLKFDGCYADIGKKMEHGYAKMAKYLNQTGRPIVFSCSFPAYEGLEANYSAAVEHCNLWRNYGDIDDQWADVQDISEWFSYNQEFLRKFAGPGHWNDPDMLLIGNFGLSFEQARSQMMIWSILAAPLLMSTDLSTIDLKFQEILLNKDAIAVNQDVLGIPGELKKVIDNMNIWTRPLSEGRFAIGVVSNRTDGYRYPVNVTLHKAIPSENTYFKVKDIFSNANLHKSVYHSAENVSVRIPPSGCVFLELTPVSKNELIDSKVHEIRRRR